MHKHFTFFLIDIVILLVPLAGDIIKKSFISNAYRWPRILIVALLFTMWDSFFVKWGIWSFNEEFLSNCKIAGFPAEEIIFYIVSQYAFLFVYDVVVKYSPFRDKPDRGPNILLVVGIFLIDAAIFYRNRAYTFSVGMLCGVAFVFIYMLRKRIQSYRVDLFLVTFLRSLVPFLTINGVLSLLPVVRYNFSQVIPSRFLSFPIEDIFYGMLVMIASISIVSRRKD